MCGEVAARVRGEGHEARPRIHDREDGIVLDLRALEARVVEPFFGADKLAGHTQANARLGCSRVMTAQIRGPR